MYIAESITTDCELRTFQPRRPLSTAYKNSFCTQLTKAYGPKCPASTVINSAAYLLTISSPDNQ